MKADVWQNFGFRRYEDKDELDRTKAVCKLCQTEVKYSGNTTNLRNHLSRHHGDLAKSAANQTALEKAFGVKFPSNSTRALSITEGVGIFISKDLRPYSVVENAGFKLLIKRLFTTLCPAQSQTSERNGDSTNVCENKRCPCAFTEICREGGVDM